MSYTNSNCNTPCGCGSGLTTCDCTCHEPNYDNVGCLDKPPTDCMYYNGVDDSCVNVKKRDTLTSVLQKVFNAIKSFASKVHSNTLDVKKTGACQDNLTIELIPSTDAFNALQFGRDGKPYVGRADINLVSTSCISWQKTTNNSVTTFVPVIDWNCVAQQVCPLCDNPAPCSPATGVVILSTGQNSITINWNTVGGVTYDILVNGNLHQEGEVGPYTINGLSPNTTYSITVRAKCSSGLTEDTTISATTLPLAVCNNPSSFTITIS